MWQWFLAGAVILTNVATVLIVVAVVRLHLRRLGARPTRAAADRPLESPRAQFAQARRDAEELIAQLERLAADIDERLTERSRRVQDLLAEADARAAELRRLCVDPAVLDGLGPDADPRRRDVLRLAADRVGPVEIARRTGLTVGEVELMIRLEHAAAAPRSK